MSRGSDRSALVTKCIRLAGVFTLAALTACGGGSSTQPPVPTTYMLSGSISGLPSGASGLVLTNGSSSTAAQIAPGNASFSFGPVASGSAYSVAVQTAAVGYACTVAGGSGTLNSNVSNVVVTCVLQSYTLGGTISGLGSATGLVLTNGAADATAIVANSTTFTMNTAVPYGTAYSIVVSQNPGALKCSVTQGTGTMPAAAVSSVAVTCVAYTESVLHSFGATGDGSSPEGSLMQASDGSLYGMTLRGGANMLGTAFQMSVTGTESVLHSFAGAGDGAEPQGNLIQASDGSFYGMTSGYGFTTAAGALGTVIKITPAGVESVLYSWACPGNVCSGANPFGSLLQASDGDLYGMIGASSNAGDYGNVFKITLAGAESVLYAFKGGSDAANPSSSLIQASDGNFYGTSAGYGSSGYGAVFKLTPAGVESVIYSFQGGNDGAYPYGSLIEATDGNFYGTTSGGDVATDLGTVFKITSAGVETVLYAFKGGSDGAYPNGSLIQASDGNLYGLTTGDDLPTDLGTVFKITPAGVETAIYAFKGGNDGAYPYGSLIQASDGNFYGMSAGGGINGNGTAFVIH